MDNIGYHLSNALARKAISDGNGHVRPPTLPKSANKPPILPRNIDGHPELQNINRPPTLPKRSENNISAAHYPTREQNAHYSDAQSTHTQYDTDQVSPYTNPSLNYPDDPFSSQFEDHIENGCDDQHINQTSVLETDLDIGNTEACQPPNNGNLSEDWPEPPDDLDQFSKDPEPIHGDPEYMQNSVLQVSESTDVLNALPVEKPRVKADDDCWSVMCDQGSKLSIMDETNTDDVIVPPPHRNPYTAKGMDDSDQFRRNIRSSRRRQQSYENMSLIAMPSQSDSKLVVQYENVTPLCQRPNTISGLPTDDHTSHTEPQQNRRATDYENYIPPDMNTQTPEQNETESSPLVKSIGSGAVGDPPGDLDNLDYISDDCFYSDDEFDDDDGEVYDDDDDVINDDTLSVISGEKDSDNGDDPLQTIILKLRDTERYYVNKLHFICKVVMMSLRVLQKIPNVSCLPADTQKLIFGKIEIIYNFHSSNILPSLEEIVTHWDDHSNVGKSLRGLVPYMKIYLEYAENYKALLEQYDYWMQKSTVFSALIHESQECPELSPLTVREVLQDIASHVPSYQAALRDYLDNQSPGAPDRQYLEESTASLTQTCYELDRAMGKDDRMKTLKEVQLRLDGSISIVKATRELCKEGHIQIIHTRSGKTFDRYMLLFNDLLLLCTPKQNSGKHRVLYQEIRSKTKVHEGDNLFYQYTFYIQGSKQAIECKCTSKDVKYQWMQLISHGPDTPAWMSTDNYKQDTHKPSQGDLIGRIKPEMMPLSHAEACTLCNVTMGTVRRKYHCMACGRIVCSKCCKLKTALEYTGNMKVRVCDECYTLIEGRELGQGTIQVTTSDGDDNVVTPQQNRICGYLKMSANKARGWKRRWFVIQNDSVLYCFNDHKTTEVWSSLLLKRFSVSSTTQTDAVFKTTAFKLYNSRRTYYMKADGPDSAQLWINTIADLCDSAA